MENFSIKDIKEEKVNISEGEINNRYQLKFESLDEEGMIGSITLSGQGSLKTVVSV